MVRDKKNKIAEEQRMILEVPIWKSLVLSFFLIHFDSLQALMDNCCFRLSAHTAAGWFLSKAHLEQNNFMADFKAEVRFSGPCWLHVFFF